MKTKAKRLFLWIVVAFMMLAGMKGLFIANLGEHWGQIIFSFIVLGAALLHVVYEKLYNSGNWIKGWDAKTSMLNILACILLLIGVVMDWSVAENVTLSGSFLDIMTKFTVWCNTGIALINAPWSDMMKSLETQNQKSLGDGSSSN